MQKKIPPWIAGIDEAGRGPLAGPVIAAAVILDPNNPILGLKDSKLLNVQQREVLFVEICEKALAFAVGRGEVAEIDSINILQASLLAMQRAAQGLRIMPTLALIDGNKAPKLPYETQTIIDGDASEPCISAASILAKVTRDREMILLDQQYPDYGFAKHKGYATPEHRAALKKYGPCDIHRRSFAPVATFYLQHEEAVV